jgi:hypothetical protein
VLVLRTLGAPERRHLRARRARPVDAAEPEPVPTARATIVRAQPFGSSGEAAAWLGGLRADRSGAEAELASALRLLNRARHARRTAAADPYAGDLSADHALVVRLGYGAGVEVAEGRFAAAVELSPSAGRRARRSMESPDERFAALIGGRDRPLMAEELVLRARSDLDAGREGELALQARIALEALTAELGPETVADLEAHREPLERAAAAALRPGAEPPAGEAMAEALAAMERVLRRRRLGR